MKILLIKRFFFLMSRVLLFKPILVFSKSFLILDKMRILIGLLRVFVLLLTLERKKLNRKKKNIFFLSIITLNLIILFFFFFRNRFFWLFLFFEIRILPIFLLIRGWGYQLERLQAGYYLLAYTTFFSLPFFLFLVNLSETSLIFFFSKKIFLSLFLSLGTFFLFLVKSPIYFFHLWLPKAHVESPVTGSILLAGALLKLGGYGFIRIFLLFIIKPSITFWIFFFTILGRLISSIICFFQRDQKAAVAYIRIGHIRIFVSSIRSLFFFRFKGGILIIFLHAIVSPIIFFISYLFFLSTLNRVVIFNQSILSWNFFLRGFIIFFLLSNFGVPPFPSFFREVIIFKSCFLISKNFFWFVLRIVFLGCLYRIFFLVNSTHGKPRPENFLLIFFPNFFGLLGLTSRFFVFFFGLINYLIYFLSNPIRLWF